uniref:Cytochrome P450 n=1 Tax=Chelydra serpentina TaxID=8475 RepID=A0A8C3TCR3_CHESE
MELVSASLLLLLCLCCILLASAWQSRGQRGQLPPGPTPLPVLGNFLQLDRANVIHTLVKVSSEPPLGPIFSLYPDFPSTSRKALSFSIIRLPGVVFTNGERWKQMRRFCLTVLRNFGMGKRSIEERIQEEAQCLLEELWKTRGAPFDPIFNVSRAVSNIICSIVFGNRFDYEDETFITLNKLIVERFRFAAGFPSLQLYNSFPGILKKIPGPHHMGSKYAKQIISFISERIKMQQATLDLNAPQNFIDCFLVKMEQEKQNPATEFSQENLVMATFNLFFAGTETVSTTLRYGFLLLLKHPRVQEKIHREIDAVIGRDRAPTAEDRGRMPYTDATLHEIQRFSDILPMSLPHTVTRDTRFRGYLIPQGTYVCPLLSTVHFDPEEHQSPEAFAPERFLSENGSFKKQNAFLPFSAGKRVCLGEGLARMELFLFFTTVLQRFALSSPVDPQRLSLVPDVSNFGKVPPRYQLCLRQR